MKLSKLFESLDRLEDTRLLESYDNLPQWIIDFLDRYNTTKNNLVKRGINLKSAIFQEVLPGNINSKNLNDSSKLWILDLLTPTRYGSPVKHIYIPGIPSTDTEVYIGSRYRKLSNTAANKLAEMCVRGGYIDLNDSSNRTTDIRNSRRHTNFERDYSKAQYPRKVNVQYGVKPDGGKDYNNILSYDIEWVTHSGYDKNGYKLDPDKYIRLLNQVGCDNCAQRLERIFTQLEDLRARLVKVINNFQITDSTKYRSRGFHNNLFDDMGDALRTFSDIVNQYTRLKDRIDKLLAREPRPDNIDERIQHVFEWDGQSLSKDIKALTSTIKSLENPIPLPQIEEED